MFVRIGHVRGKIHISVAGISDIPTQIRDLAVMDRITFGLTEGEGLGNL